VSRPYDESWPSRSSYFGINDLVGLPKDRFTYTEAVGIPRNQPFISCHIGTGKAVKEKSLVFVYTNYNSAELL
jgi:beta-galactosidase